MSNRSGNIPLRMDIHLTWTLVCVNARIQQRSVTNNNPHKWHLHNHNMANFTSLCIVAYVVLCIMDVVARPPEQLPQGPIDTDESNTELTKSEKNQSSGMRVLREKFNRLPGVCRRLKRRRITILCNVEKFCSTLRDSQQGHICACPKGSRCTHFFLKSF